MKQAWYSIISEEMEQVESNIFSILHSDNAELNEMCRYVTASGGKRIRPAVCILAYYACGGQDLHKVIEVSSAFEIAHTATLVHDDINDKSEIRRGCRTLHKKYCVSKAIIAGDFMMAKSFQALGSSSKDIIDVIVEAASGMSESEFIQKDFEHASVVTEDDYDKIIHGKTAMLISASAKAGAFLAGADCESIEAMGSYAISIGMAFQIIDDLLDVIGESGVTGKRTGIDLIEGKPTIPTILAMQDPVFGPKICEIFSRENVTDDDVDEALELIKKTGAIDKCRRKAEMISKQAVENLNMIPDSPYRDSLVMLAEFVVSRDR